jgi:hypothetical protein
VIKPAFRCDEGSHDYAAFGRSVGQVHVYLLELVQEAISSFIISTETGLLTSASLVDVPYVKVRLYAARQARPVSSHPASDAYKHNSRFT